MPQLEQSLHPATLKLVHRQPLQLLATALALALCFLPMAWAGRQMLLHIVVMTALAPLLILSLRQLCKPAAAAGVLLLWAATSGQALLFVFWHSPSGMGFAMQQPGAEWLLHGSLLLAAGLFWWSLLQLQREHAWHAILALLLSGKLFCLVAVVLAFSPRALYPMMSLADQQFAGLIMIVLCPLCYMASALWICLRWLAGLEPRESGATRDRLKQGERA